MTKEIIIAGYGGQGVLSMGKILAYAGLMEGKEVSWMPAYGPEQRGGTANVTVILSDAPISSPILSEFDIAIVLNQASLYKFEEKLKPGGTLIDECASGFQFLLNQASLYKFEEKLKPGGTLIYDPNGIMEKPKRDDIEVFCIPATETAVEMRNPKAFNMLVLGGLLKAVPLVHIENVMKGLRKTLPERHHHLIPMNEEALLKGMDIIEKNMT